MVFSKEQKQKTSYNMKKLVCLHVVMFVAVIFPFISLGQIEKGKFLIGGALNFNRSNSTSKSYIISLNNSRETETKNGGIKVDFGYFIKENLAVGIKGGYNKSHIDEKNNLGSAITNEQNAQAFNAGPFLRYYIPITTRFYFSLLGEMTISTGKNFSSTTNNMELEETNAKVNSFTVLGMPSISYFFTKRIALELSGLGVSLSTSKVKETHSNNGQAIGEKTSSATALNFNPFETGFLSNFYLGGKFYF
jgi:outer membrane protein W